MKMGNFNIEKYLKKLYENEEREKASNEVNREGFIVPEENRKSYDWLKKEYKKGQTEVKIEISGDGARFKPNYDMQAKTDSVKELKPQTFKETSLSKQEDKEEKSEKTSKTNDKNDDIKDREEKNKKEVKKIDVKTK